MELTGRRIRLIGVPGYEKAVFTVQEMRHELAVCQGEEGTLLLPVNGALSFGVMVLEEKEEEKAPEKPQAEPAPAPAQEQEKAAPEKAPLPYEEGTVYTGRVIYWQGHWGKIEHPGLRGGLFFHMTMIGDDDLLTVLNAPNHDMPEVTYSVTKNPRRISGICASDVRLASDDTGVTDEEPDASLVLPGEEEPQTEAPETEEKGSEEQ